MTQEQNTKTVTLSIENMKESFHEMLKEQEQVLFKILSSCINALNERFVKLTLKLTTTKKVYEDKLNKLIG